MFLGAGTAARRARRPGASAGPQARRARGWAVAAIGLSATGCAALCLTAVTWTMPTTRTGAEQVQLQQRIALRYTAAAAPGPTYPTGRIQAPDPLFLRLVTSMKVQVSYRTLVNGPAEGDGFGGTRRMTAELRTTNGWHRGIELLPRAGFEGSGFDATATVDLKRVRALISSVERQTRVEPRTYTLAVRSEIALGGTVNTTLSSTPVRVTFFPELVFAYDGKQLRLTNALASNSAVGAFGAVGAVGAAGGHQVIREQASTVTAATTLAARLGDSGPTVQQTRIGGPLVGGLLLLLAGLAELGRRTARKAAPERIVRRIVLDDPSTTTARERTPGPRTIALGERQWARTRSNTRYDSN